MRTKRTPLTREQSRQITQLFEEIQASVAAAAVGLQNISTMCTRVIEESGIKPKRVDITGAEVKRLRKRMQASQSDFAEWIGCSRETVNRWENEPEAKVSQRYGNLIAALESEAKTKERGA